MEENDVFKLTVRYEKENVLRKPEIISMTSTVKHADKILDLIQINPGITVNELMIELSLSESSIRKIFARLTAQKIIERKGSRKAGEWVIL